MHFLSVGRWFSFVCRFPVSHVDADVACLVSSMRGTIVVPCSYALGGMFRVVFVLSTVANLQMIIGIPRQIFSNVSSAWYLMVILRF